MQEYRLYFKGRDGRIRHRLDLEYEDDEDAIGVVAKHDAGEAMELWHGARSVQTFPPS
jgi:predicted Zn-dependent protease